MLEGLGIHLKNREFVPLSIEKVSAMNEFRKGSAMGVLGPLPAAALGRTLTHEHISMQFEVAYKEAYEGIQVPPNDRRAFELRNLGTLRQYPYAVRYNIYLNDADTESIIADELQRFKAAGGSTIVENTTVGIDRKADFLKKLSTETGVNIIAGTGYYIAAAQKSTTLTTKVEEMQSLMVGELTEGVAEDASVRCGVIGEIAASWPLHSFEKSVIEAVAHAQQATNAPVTFHPGRNAESPFEVIRVFTEAGGNARDVVMSHLDRTLFEDEQLLDFAKLGPFTQFDLFGTEVSHYQLQEEVDMPSDAQRVQKLQLLKNEGFLSKILLSHDIHTKQRLVNFGGHGYGHIYQNVLPKMLNRGFSPSEIETILVGNPQRWLTAVE